MRQSGTVGARIRDRRTDIGMRQAALAKSVGISASYLNLIEHNRRKIGGKLLSDIASELDIKADWLSNGAENALLSALEQAGSTLVEPHNLEHSEDLAGRFPGWAALIVAQSERIAALQENVAAMSDRMTHDPALANALHEVISAVTAIRSSASILVGTEVLDRDWQDRFHRNIYDDSRRLAINSETLIAYLDAPDADIDLYIAPQDEIQAVLAQLRYHIPQLEGDDASSIDAVLADIELTNSSSRPLLVQYLKHYRDDAIALPLGPFATSAKENHCDPLALSRMFNVPLDQIMRRLAVLGPDLGLPPMGIVVIDAAGGVAFQKPVAGFDMYRSGGHCPLWPVFSALSRPEQPIRAVATLPDGTNSRFQCYAIATTHGDVGFDMLPQIRATMLVIPDPANGDGPSIPVGMACRICPRENCAARREPAIVGSVGARL